MIKYIKVYIMSCGFIIIIYYVYRKVSNPVQPTDTL